MARSTAVELLVCWGEQRRAISIDEDESIDSIKTKINQIYEDMNNSDPLEAFQIQYYDEKWRIHLDLILSTETQFRSLLKQIQLDDSNNLSLEHKCLKIVEKCCGNKKQKTQTLSQESTDTFTFQNINDKNRSINLNVSDEPVPTSSCTEKKTTETSTSIELVTMTIPTGVTPFLSHRQSHCICSQEWPKDYQLQFGGTFAYEQRSQYLKDMRQGKNTTGESGKAGCNLKTVTDGEFFVGFDIANNDSEAEWCLHLFILTEHDRNDIHYIHPSKSLYDRSADDTVNNQSRPLHLILSKNHLSEKKCSLILKVINLTPLPTLKNSSLNSFPAIRSAVNAQEPEASSSQSMEKTLKKLNLNAEKFHLGCILTKNGTIVDRCVSEEMFADPIRSPSQQKKRSRDAGEDEKSKQ